MAQMGPLGIPEANLRDLNSAMRVRSTVFVLGQGSSINLLTPNEWDAIASGESIALNYWPRYHHFRPTVLLTEVLDAALAKALNRATITGHTRRIILSGPAVTHEQFRLGLTSCSSEVLNRLRWLPTFSSPAFTYSGVQAVLEASLKMTREFQQMFVPRYMSIVRATLLAMELGFTDVVLIGVDLQGPYFFDKSSAKVGRQHSTNERICCRPPASRLIKALAEICALRHVTLRANHASPLTEILGAWGL